MVDDWWWSASARQGDWPTLTGPSVFFRPFASLVFVSWFRMFGPNPFAYRVMVLTLLTLTAFGIRGIWLKLSLSKQGTGAALFAGAAFILWPTHAEAVGWISCFSDQLVAAFGTLSIWAFLSYAGRPRLWPFLAGSLFMVIALLSKEAAIVLPIITVVLAWAHTRQVDLQNPRRALLALAVIAVALLMGYVGLRTACLHTLTGGYGRNSLSLFIAAFIGLKFTTNLANDFFPVARYLALYGTGHGIAWIRPLILIVILGPVGAMLRKPGRTRPLSPNAKRFVAGFFVFGVVWLLWALYGVMSVGALNEIIAGNPILEICFGFAMLLLGFLIWRLVRRNWITVVDWLTDHRVDLAWVPATILLAELVEHLEMITLVDGLWQVALIGYFLWVVYATRPLVNPRSSTVKARGTRVVAITLLFSAFFALIPSVTLPIGFDGQQSRFSYLGSVFSVLFFVCAYSYLLRKRNLKIGAGIAIALILFLAQIPATEEWVKAGDISRETARAIIATPHSHKTFILTAPRSFGSADLFIGGLDVIPFVLLGTHDLAVEPGMLVDGMVADDIVESEALGGNRFSILLKPGAASRWNPLGFHSHDMPKNFKISQKFDNNRTGSNHGLSAGRPCHQCGCGRTPLCSLIRLPDPGKSSLQLFHGRDLRLVESHGRTSQNDCAFHVLDVDFVVDSQVLPHLFGQPKSHAIACFGEGANHNPILATSESS